MWFTFWLVYPIFWSKTFREVSILSLFHFLSKWRICRFVMGCSILLIDGFETATSTPPLPHFCLIYVLISSLFYLIINNVETGILNRSRSPVLHQSRVLNWFHLSFWSTKSNQSSQILPVLTFIAHPYLYLVSVSLLIDDINADKWFPSLCCFSIG
jgi:hypothetical protein